MDEMLGYIFRNLKMSDHSIRYINRYLARQSKINRNLAIVAIASIVYISVSEIRRKELEEEVRRLNEELNVMKGD